jgi:hypothetical protein
VKRKNGATVFGNQAAIVPPFHLSVAVADALFLGSCHPSPSARRFLFVVKGFSSIGSRPVFLYRWYGKP